EFSRPIRIDTIGADPRPLTLAAEEPERAALAKRFGLPGITKLEAELTLARRADEVIAAGTMRAEVTQSCVVTAEPVPAKVEVPFEILFRPQPQASGTDDDEVELSETELDVVFYDGPSVDVGEAVAETLSLSLDPYPRAPGAEAVLKQAGVKSEEEAGPFGALAALRDKLKRD
ncbi:MAG TPA: DUF177 domain-containing protein, partial [Allosphingosinicella sp.]|nr:DUF177 domain-containing protein [Allosphingosinicella sp.]